MSLDGYHKWQKDEVDPNGEGPAQRGAGKVRDQADQDRAGLAGVARRQCTPTTIERAGRLEKGVETRVLVATGWRGARQFVSC